MSNVIYCAEMAEVNIIKIGFTTQLEKRLKTLWTDSPLRGVRKYVVEGARYPQVTLLRTFEVPDRKTGLEPALHYYFRGTRVHGEWFCSHAVKEPLMALQEADLHTILQEYWESCPRTNRPQEFREARKHQATARFSSNFCKEHRSCRFEHDMQVARSIPPEAETFTALQWSVPF